MINIALFASGAGSNAAVIIKTLHQYITPQEANVAVIITNNENAGVINIAHANNIPVAIINLKKKDEATQTTIYQTVLEQHNIDFIVLAGYLKKIPAAITHAFPQQIINIHPALLPAYGGPGMYGTKVHEAVIAAGEQQSGITIHYVDEVYDHGAIIFQATCAVEATDTPDSLAQKIHQLEHQWFTKTIAQVLQSQK